MDGITKLRGLSNWAYVQQNMFPGQGDDFDKVFIFKMSEVGPGSGVDLVKRMQPSGNLEHVWSMFGSCLITSNVLPIGLQWLVMFMMLHINVS